MIRLYDSEMTEPWLLLTHQIPASPGYLRVKIGRRLHQVGAVQVKSSVYVLPHSDQATEDLEWIRREVVGSGGEACIFRAACVAGVEDTTLRGRFDEARDADYRAILDACRALAAELADGPTGAHAEFGRIRRQLEVARAIDYFGAPLRAAAEQEVQRLESAMRGGTTTAVSAVDFVGRTWVTRPGVKVDRMASAWFIRRFIDAGARFRFVDRPEDADPGELRFDMYAGEFTHERDLCTFEVLVDRFAATDPGLRAIAELIHDLDLKDAKHGRPETAGLGAFLAGIAATRGDDIERILAASTVFDALHAWFAERSP